MKIIDKINKLIEDKTTFFSFEYFPPRTDEGVDNLFTRIDSMGQMNPVFIDVTWGAGGSTSERTLGIVQTVQKYHALETMMHLTCTNISRNEILSALNRAKDSGIQNILALRGDPPKGEEVWKEQEGGFAHASDLVRFIKENFGDYFGIAVAGYPERHSDSASSEEDLKFLKEKVEAGADFIVTQLFYDTALFLKFVIDCRETGITCPIIPGIMPIHTFAGFSRMTTLCKTSVPQHITDALEAIKDNDEAVKDFGVKLAIEMCQELHKGGIYGFHFYTLNLEKSVARIVEGLGFPTNSRSFPWRASLEKGRVKEEVRPVFWQHRQKSYVKRTEIWDDFPNGRWGDSRSPAFGELSDYHLGAYSNKTEKPQWVRQLNSLDDLIAVFVDYCKGELKSLPWNDLALAEESNTLKSFLFLLNSNGFLTINSQPAVNGVPSTHPTYGWGGPSGWVYQKAYVEFFVSEDSLPRLLAKITQKKYSYLTYHAINSQGDKSYTNTTGTNALTWGVFPDSEIKQPTVVDSTSFLVWKDEAFSLWRHWAEKYPEESEAKKILNKVDTNWFLMNIVDNDFTDPRLFSFFETELRTDLHH